MQILEAAEALFLERGFKGVSMKDVAEALCITPAALYYHFPRGKEELFAATIRHFLQQMLARAFAPLQSIPPTASFRDRLTLLTRDLLRLPVDRLAPLLRDAHEYLREDKPHFGRDIARDYSEHMASLFSEAQKAGEIEPRYPAELLVTLHQGMCTSLLTRRHMGGEDSQPFDEEHLAGMVVATLLDGIGVDPTADPPS